MFSNAIDGRVRLGEPFPIVPRETQGGCGSVVLSFDRSN